jgi:predicted O-methyltransferase YrrM
MKATEIAEKDNWGFLREAEVSALQSLVHLAISDKTSSPLFVNLGSGHGTSSLAMAEACPEADIYSVDNNLWFMECERKTFNEAGKKQPHQIHSNCHDPDLVFEHEVDLIFVDADHRENEVRSDILKWFQYIRNKGIIAFHDYGHPNYPGVRIAVDELMDGQEEILFIETIKAFRCMT